MLLVLLPAVVLGGVGGDYEDDDLEDQEQAQNHKEVGGFNGHSREFFDSASAQHFSAFSINEKSVL